MSMSDSSILYNIEELYEVEVDTLLSHRNTILLCYKSVRQVVLITSTSYISTTTEDLNFAFVAL